MSEPNQTTPRRSWLDEPATFAGEPVVMLDRFPLSAYPVLGCLILMPAVSLIILGYALGQRLGLWP